MRILFLSPYPPYPPHSGGALRIYHMLRGIAAHHDIWLLTFVPSPAARAALHPLERSCTVIPVEDNPQRSMVERARETLCSPLPDMARRNHSLPYLNALHNLLATTSFDIVHAASIEMAVYGLKAMDYYDATAADQQCRPLFILDEFNAEYIIQQRAARTGLRDLCDVSSLTHHASSNLRKLLATPYSFIQWYKLAAYERNVLHRFDNVLAVSEQDRLALLHLHSQARISIIPNGVDTTTFAPIHCTLSVTVPQPPTLVFTGTMDFRPNSDAVTWFARTILPRIANYHPDVRFLIVGRSPTPAVQALHDGHTVVVTGEVDDVRPFIANASVYVVPMRIGGGVRLKVLEALAMQAPIVSTTMGATGIENLYHGTHLLLADTPDTFAAAILLLLQNPDLGTRMGEAGRTLVCQMYDWQVIVPMLEQVYNTRNRV